MKDIHRSLGALFMIWSHAFYVMADTNDAFQFFREEAMVTAVSQHSQKLSEAPANAYVVTAEDIQRYGYRTLAEALQSVPGIYATNDRNYTYLWFRGFGRPSDYNNRVLVLVDGHRMNDAVYGGVYVANEFPVDIHAIDHIEVIKGPSSALYGDSAFLGVVNVVTRKAGQAPLLQASAESDSYGTHKEFLGIAHEFPQGLKTYLSGSYRHMNGQDLFYPQYSDVHNGVAAGSDAESNGNFFGTLSYDGFTLMGMSGSRTKHVPTAAFGTLFNDPGTQTTDTWSSVELRGEHLLLSEVTLTSRAYYDWYDYHGDYRYASAVPPPPTFTNIDLMVAKSYGEEMRLRLTPWGSPNALTLGQEFDQTVQGLQQNYNAGDPPPPFVNVNTTPQRWATYAQQEWQPYSALSLTLGARYDHYQTFGHTLNPRIAAVHGLWPNSVVKALYGTAFRAPSAFEMFYGSESSFVPNPSLTPEKIDSYELVWEQKFPGAGMVRVSGYENMVTNLIEQTTLQDGRIQFQNASSIKSIGMEFYSKWAWSKALSGFAGYDLQKTHEIDGDPLSNSPVHSGSAGLSAWVPPANTTVSLQSFFIGTRRTVQGTTLPVTALLSVILRANPSPQWPTVYAAVYNLLDTHYSVSGAAEHVQDAIPQDGRNFIVGLEYKIR